MINITLIGRLVTDPVVNEHNGRNLCSFNVAARTNRRDSSGNVQSDFYKVTVWGTRADSCSKYLSKGSMVAVSGTADQAPYVANNGEARSGMQINANQVEFLPSANASANTSANASQPAAKDDDEDLFA